MSLLRCFLALLQLLLEARPIERGGKIGYEHQRRSKRLQEYMETPGENKGKLSTNAGLSESMLIFFESRHTLTHVYTYMYIYISNSQWLFLGDQHLIPVTTPKGSSRYATFHLEMKRCQGTLEMPSDHVFRASTSRAIKCHHQCCGGIPL